MHLEPEDISVNGYVDGIWIWEHEEEKQSYNHKREYLSWIFLLFPIRQKTIEHAKGKWVVFTGT